MSLAFFVRRKALAHNLNVLESSRDDVLEKLAAYTASADQQDATRLELGEKLWLQDAFGEGAACL